ncbi:FAD:protein FMN transferase [Sphingomonas desiccabilis]|uniref:FAD:protein FMN transferase n=1 Tax=Sphingomonas desiccabilis TaxID=429134 RepID=A0A4Q2IVF4_9SPHN|nr:FAD:protein FMN transferase [Sphingomonas desiccabilis]MBB3909713.1 thiamine biosynthesis lipoprotein [Sphingomonas desiccabilis]RXZ34406.1 FAD:protein FMN transferase [Sphingomonas desiccabilis]
MGTSWSARIVGGDPQAALAIARQILGKVIAEMSHWEPDSALSRLNRAPIGSWQRLPPALVAVLASAWQVAEASGGAFDPAIGALVDLWGFGPSGPRTAPPPGETIEATHAAAGLDAFEFDPLLLRARRLRDARLDLSGIAKGYAVDALADALHAAGHADLLVEIGGEFVGCGLRPDGQPWWVAVEPLPGAALPPLRIAAHDIAIATSGDYRRSFTADGRRYAHTLDPRTGHPIAHGTASVTVLAANCRHADAWATVLTVLPPEEACAWATAHSLAARIVRRSGHSVEEWFSPALRAMLG